MQTFTKKTLTTAVLGLAVTAAAAGSASAAGLVQSSDALAPVGSAANLLPGATSTVTGAQTALSNGTSALPTGKATNLLPSDNHLSGNSLGPATGLLGGLPLGG
jgi:hypothetical protein